ncbi:MAG: DinB family protein [Bryobacteraceae bacterium]|nr:DinB family protein [Bryobacteraceae bacterium]
MSLDRLFLEFSASKLRQFSSRIEDCLGRLTPEQIWQREQESNNSIGNLVLHLSGNVRQWIGTGIGGLPPVRDRDAEFAARGGLSADQLARALRESVDPALDIIAGLTAERLEVTIEVQGYPVTVLEAVYHVVEHFAQHTGQILFATKLFTGGDLGYYRHLSAKGGHAERVP